MHLITMAHLGEALGVIEKFNLKNIENHVYANDFLVLLITGEGPFEAAIKTASIIPRFKFEKVLNFGIAGTLTSELKVGDLVSVRTIYLVHGTHPEFKTFQSAKEGIDCITSFERILDAKKAEPLKGLGKIVDREVWGVANAAKNAGLPFSSFKVISDNAGTIEACELVKEKASEFSFLLAQKLSEVLGLQESLNEEIPSLPGFHFTFTTAHKFKNLLNKISIKENITAYEVKNSLNLTPFLEKDISPKERSRLLLEEMEGRIDPTRKILNHQASLLTQEFAQAGIKLQLDPQWENPKATISLEVSDDLELQHKIKSLEQLSIKSFSEIMKGNFHVE